MKTPRVTAHVSHKKIAEISNISRTTVSNILSGRKDLPYRQETRDRVLAVAHDLGYQTNRASAAIRNGRSNLIGVIYFGGSNGSNSTAVALPRAINKQGYDYLVLDLRWQNGDTKRIINEIIQSRVEGVIISHMQGGIEKEYIEMFHRVHIPVVTLYGSDKLGIPLFCDDAENVFCALTRHLLQVGHRDLALIVYQTGARTPGERAAGFTRAFEGVGHVETLDAESYLAQERKPRPKGQGEAIGSIVYLDNPRRASVMEWTFHFAQKLFRKKQLPHALLASNDVAAYSFFHAASEVGIRIPGDIAITGFDNDPQSHYPLFNLTTVQADIEQASMAVAEALARYLKGEVHTIEEQRFGSRLILRRSCGRLVTPGEEEQIIDIPIVPRGAPLSPFSLP